VLTREGRSRAWQGLVGMLFLFTVSNLYAPQQLGFHGLESRYSVSQVTVSNASVSHPTESRIKHLRVSPPPMGWSSWNSFAVTVDSDIVVRQAKALVASGLKEVGYQYVNIDEGWWQGKRDKSGNITVDPKQWPALAPGEKAGNMANVVRFIHSLGLKAGIYTDAGESGCSYWWPGLEPARAHTGSEGHYNQDMLQFAKWGFDFVKVDWCGGDKENLDPAVQYSEIARAISRAEATTSHRLYLSICDWGNNSPWTWAPGIGGLTDVMWRTSFDIVEPIVAGTKYADRSASFIAVLSNFGKAIHPEAEHRGFYNDPDMMVVGMNGLSEEQNRIHMSLWAIAGAPLILGADLTKLNTATLATLTNREVIAIDQDVLGLQGIKVAEDKPGLQVWAKKLAGPGRRAVLLFNRTAWPGPIKVCWSELGLVPTSVARVQDLWAHKDLGSFKSSYSATVPADDIMLLTISGMDSTRISNKANSPPHTSTIPADVIVLLTVKGTEGTGTKYAANSPNNRFAGGAVSVSCRNCSSGEGVTLGNGKMLTFNQVVATTKLNFLQIAYSNGSKVPQIVELSVNGEPSIEIAFPPTGAGESVGTIIIEANLQPCGDNRLTFSAPGGVGPTLDSVSVLTGPT
jgi:Alpha galactosidase A/Alpha galactosidase C-terminal beta sandwich domain/Alpha-galactosidase, CBM13 domain